MTPCRLLSLPLMSPLAPPSTPRGVVRHRSAGSLFLPPLPPAAIARAARTATPVGFGAVARPSARHRSHGAPIALSGRIDAEVGDEEDFSGPSVVSVRAVTSAGLSEVEAGAVLSAVVSACEESGLPFHFGPLESFPTPAVPAALPGATGRILSLRADAGGGVEVDEGLAEALRYEISERLDGLGLGQPVLVSLAPGSPPAERPTLESLSRVVEEEAYRYSLRDPVSGTAGTGAGGSEEEDDPRYAPSLHVEIDGAMVENVGDGGTHWDTSSILVFDDLIDDGLRSRLLDVVLGRTGDNEEGAEIWDDAANGPDPRRWERGGLLDVPDGGDPQESDSDGPCWGLTHDATLDLCFNPHPALAEFEAELTRLFPDFVVTRLPEAVLGSSVSPLTANAPTHGDAFEYHIDADPNLAPPSPWTDVFGRYPNRSPGKPRFVSCLLYLSGEWDGDAWGAPTRFRDPPTGITYDVVPSPGRCVVMDQDVSHTVVAPNAAAGRRPRYSLVWKLVLHPRAEGQDVADLTGGRRWPKAVFVGSALPLASGEVR